MHTTCSAVHDIVDWQHIPIAIIPTAFAGTVGGMNDTVTGDS